MYCPVEIGERLIVQGIMYARAVVSEVKYLENEARWEIVLDWGEFGKSKVYDHDEGKVWYRFKSCS